MVLRCCSPAVLQSKPKNRRGSSLPLTLSPHPDGSTGWIGWLGLDGSDRLERLDRLEGCLVYLVT